MAVYIPPSEVTSPRRQWSLISVLFDPREPGKCVLAIGRWDNRPVLAMRWNGTANSPIGNPQSRGLPTWFIVPEMYNEPLIATLSPEMQTLAQNFLPIRNSLWFEDIKAAMEGFATDGWTISSGRVKGPTGEKLIGVEFIDPLRHGCDGRFDVSLPEDATHEHVKREVRAALRKYFRTHPITRGARTIGR
jgi:hypothetical protein